MEFKIISDTLFEKDKLQCSMLLQPDSERQGVEWQEDPGIVGLEPVAMAERCVSTSVAAVETSSDEATMELLELLLPSGNVTCAEHKAITGLGEIGTETVLTS